MPFMRVEKIFDTAMRNNNYLGMKKLGVRKTWVGSGFINEVEWGIFFPFLLGMNN